MASTADVISAHLTLAIDARPIVVRAVNGQEHVSRAFRYEVEFSAPEINLDDLRGSLAELVIVGGDGGERVVHGLVDEVEIVASVAQGQSIIDTFRYRLVLTPVHATLAFSHGFRIFQDMTTLEICQDVFKRAGISTDHYSIRTHGAYPKRVICVQYDESEWSLICRLLEAEGIWFCFEHAVGKHVMVICDDNLAAARLSPDTIEHHFTGPIGGQTKATDVTFAHIATVSKAAIKDTDPLLPSTDLYAEIDARLALGREHYEFPSGVFDPKRTKEMATRRLDSLSWRKHLLHARTNVFYAEAGRIAAFTDHAGLGDDYFIVGVDMDIVFVSDVPVAARDNDVDGARCDVSLSLMPQSQTFRPERVTPRPIVAGLQTARVTGPAGEEIHTDADGRVKVQFHWDRDSQLDDKTSCWIRVSQAHTTGSFLVPRVGWEVLIEHEEGDPDRPLCLGRVYNPFFPPPFALPANKSTSAHRSYSSPGGGGVNEISIDDAGGSELVKLFGQKNVNVVAGNNRTRNVTRHESASVGVNRSVKVGTDEMVVVQANLSESVTADHKIHIGGSRRVSVGGALTEEITGSCTVSVGSIEFLHVGNTVQAVIDSVLSDAVSACESAAAGLLAPLQDQVTKAQQALEELGAMGEAFGAAVGVNVETAVDAAVDAAVTAGVNALGAKRGEGGAGGDGGAGDAASAAGPAGSAGNGSWAIEVGANVTESIGGLALFASLKGLSLGVGGDSTETIAAARIEKVGGGKAETTTESKIETVGSYKVEAKEGIKLDVGGKAAITIGGALEQDIGEGHAIVSGAKATLKTKTLDLKADNSITFQCGMAKLVINGSGVSLQGVQVTLEGDEIQLKPPAIKPG